MRRHSIRGLGRTVWHGTHEETIELLDAALRYCSCGLDEDRLRVTTCPPHVMVFDDQRVLDGLVFARRMNARLWAEEFAGVGPTP